MTVYNLFFLQRLSLDLIGFGLFLHIFAIFLFLNFDISLHRVFKITLGNNYRPIKIKIIFKSVFMEVFLLLCQRMSNIFQNFYLYFYSLHTCLFQLQKQVYQQQSRMKIKIFLALLAIALLAHAQEPEIIDFTYTHVLQEGGGSSDLANNIVLSPDSKKIEKHSFPEICDLKEKLDQGMDPSSMATRSIDVDEHLKTLRSKVLQLLRLIEEMKNLKATLAQIQEDYEPELEGFNSSHFSEDLKRLADKQRQLAALRSDIQKSTLKLNNLIEQYNLNPKNQQFNEVNLNYHISFANSKITFYQNLKTAIKRQKSTQNQPINYNQYFATLKDHFEHVNGHLDDIDNVISNYARKKVLEEKIVSWNNKIEIEKLLLNEKIDCKQSKEKIRGHNHFNEEIKKTFNDLRQKKKEFDGMNNTQCEGVAKKLEEKIKSELKITNRAFMCSQGLEETQDNLRIKQLEAEKLKKQLDELRLGELDVYQRNYNKTMSAISTEFEIMKGFAVDQYIHSEEEINKLLQDARKSKENMERQLKALPDASKSTTNFKDLEKLVQQIKKQKAKYCKEFSSYEQDSREVWNKVYKSDKRQRQLSHLRSQYIAYGQKFLALEADYKTIGGDIVRYLESQQQKA